MRPRINARAGFALLMGLLLLEGCGPAARVRVSGEVTYEGQPLVRGTIVFAPEEASAGPSTGAEIVDGRYEVPGELGVSPGVSYRVEITSLAKSGKFIANPFDPKGPPLELDANFLPASYNMQSMLRAKVGARDNRFDFALKKDGQ